MDQKFNRKINKNFDGKVGIWRREMKPRNAKQEGVGGIRMERVDVKKES